MRRREIVAHELYGKDPEGRRCGACKRSSMACYRGSRAHPTYEWSNVPANAWARCPVSNRVSHYDPACSRIEPLDPKEQA